MINNNILCYLTLTLGELATGQIAQFLWRMARCNSLEWGASERRTRGPAKRGSGSAGDAATAFQAPASRCGVAPSCGRHCSALRGRTIPRRCALPCTPKTAHSTPSNYRI